MRILTILFTALVVLSTVSCHAPGPAGDFHGPAFKTGFRTWDIADIGRNQTLQCEVWYPIDAKTPATPVIDSAFRRVPAAIDAPIAKDSHQYPLILLAPDFGYGPDSLVWLAEILVANGYIVAGVHHDDLALDGTPQVNLWDHPLDISALLTSLLSSTLGSSIDTTRIGLAGYAAGGLTGVWLGGGVAAQLEPQSLFPQKEDANIEAFKQADVLLKSSDIAAWKRSYRDPRIKAFFLMAPSWNWIFKESDLKNMPVDVFIVAGADDDQISTGRNAVRYAQWIPQAQFKELQDHTGHFEFMSAFTPQGLEAFRPRLTKDSVPTLPLEHRRRFVHQEVGELAVNFFNHHLHHSK